jgi:hypothetical protein
MSSFSPTYFYPLFFFPSFSASNFKTRIQTNSDSSCNFIIFILYRVFSLFRFFFLSSTSLRRIHRLYCIYPILCIFFHYNSFVSFIVLFLSSLKPHINHHTTPLSLSRILTMHNSFHLFFFFPSFFLFLVCSFYIWTFAREVYRLSTTTRE